MSAAKRKRAPTKKTANKKKYKAESDSEDYGSEFSDQGDNAPPDEILIDGELEKAEKLPEELLKSLSRDGGKLLIAGQVAWEMAGKRDVKKISMSHPNLYTFHRLTDRKYKLAVSSCSAVHSVLITEEGKAYTIGRNPSGQLGVGDTKTRDMPTEVTGLEDLVIIGAATGRHHTLFLTDTGTVYACGDNKFGQCGVGNQTAVVNKPTRIKYRGPPIIKVGCGADFSVILDVKGGLHTFGLPEFGQLGHNTEGKYFVTSNKISFHCITSPKKVVLYIEKAKDGHVTPIDAAQIVDFSCGTNHTVAIDSQKRCFSWGFGGFGRLGHAEPKDEFVPRLIKYFDSQSRGVRSVYCGGQYSLAINDLGQLFLFGQNKKTGEANMYPKPVQDLSGWNITAIGTSNTSIMISADDTLIAWGASPTYGELGLGDLQKSSSTPKEVSRLEGMKIPQVTMGYSHTLLLVDTDDAKTLEKYEKMPVFEIDP
ncbi:protein RCC2 homolog [Ctenocephalides felis]|uniref:protein RCC2 homolog n=1 Tax=Ctenocephalides felis TaxID=7515 RepID=UPI000E6E2CB3|nr:protein RCC2 homolog [Ctenocephalides felis]